MSRTDEIRERLDAAGREYRADDGREAHRRDAIVRAPTDISWLLDRADELADLLDEGLVNGDIVPGPEVTERARVALARYRGDE